MLKLSLRKGSPMSLTNHRLLRELLARAKRTGGRVHFTGQCTDAHVFADTQFLGPLFQAAFEEGFDEGYVHCFLMSMARRASSYLRDVDVLAPPGFSAMIGSVHSCHTAMDKSRRWELTAVSYNALMNAKFANVTDRRNAEAFLDSLEGPSPEFSPLLLSEDATLRRDDLVILFNFREDKSFQLAHALIRGLENAEKRPPNLNVLPLILYDQSLIDVQTMLPPPNHSNSLGGWLSVHGHKQLRVAESYKRPHVTTFFSGGIMQPIFTGEDCAQIESVPDSVVEFFPEMNGSLVTKTAIEGIESKRYKLIVVNYGNIDATGHSGNATAVRIAAQFIDKWISDVLAACQLNDYALFITGDHGNGEENLLLSGEPQVEHTLNNVPFLTNVKGFRVKHPTYGQAPFIGNVAATILTILGMEVPPEMADSLLERLPQGMSPFVLLFSGFLLGLIAAFLALILARQIRCMRVRIRSTGGSRKGVLFEP
jgi:2,3-bisphosphoglycerate-independent phosphoglycerate mutase